MLMYKYRPWNGFTAEVIREKRIFFPSKERLNDPAELVHPLQFQTSTWDSEFEQSRASISKETFALADEISTKFRRLQSLIDCGHDEPRNDAEFSRYSQIQDPFWRTVEAVFDKSEVHDAIAYYSLVLAEDKCNIYDSEENIIDRLNAKLQEVGVLSLSGRDDCPVMWAHYAENHQGVVLIFDTDQDPLFGRARPIEYVDIRPLTTVASVIENLYRKAEQWKYEQEYRVLRKPGDATYGFSPDALAGVILGMWMTESDRRSALSLVSIGKTVAYQAFPDPLTFSIRYERVGK